MSALWSGELSFCPPWVNAWMTLSKLERKRELTPNETKWKHSGGTDIKKIFYPILENIFSYQDPRDLDLPLLEKVKWQPSTLTTSFSPSHWWTLTGLQTPIFR